MSDNEFYTRLREKLQHMHLEAPENLFSSYNRTVQTLTSLVALYYTIGKSSSKWIIVDSLKILGLDALKFMFYPAAITSAMGLVGYMGAVIGGLIMTRMEMDLDKMDEVGDYKIKLGRYKRDGSYSFEDAQALCRKYKIRVIPELEFECYRKIALNLPPQWERAR